MNTLLLIYLSFLLLFGIVEWCVIYMQTRIKSK